MRLLAGIQHRGGEAMKVLQRPGGVLLLLLLPALALSQSRFSAAISGRVLDASGAPVPGATVELDNRDLGLHRKTTTTPDGNFVFAGLPVTGRYRVSVQQPGL